MTYNQLIKRSGFLLCSICIILGLSSFVGYAPISDAPGTITFIGEAGSPNEFTFTKWQFTQVSLPEDDFEKVNLEVEINTSSLQTNWKDLEKSIRKKKDYFYVKKFPKAYINVEGATLQADGTYTTNAKLTLKGISKELPLTFTVSKEKPYVVKGSGVIQRRQFNFYGDGPKDEVPVTFEATLPVE